jgi:hypothetical protein
MRGHGLEFGGLFGPELAPKGRRSAVQAVLRRRTDAPHGGCALIAAMSGFTPRMLMTRVRL